MKKHSVAVLGVAVVVLGVAVLAQAITNRNQGKQIAELREFSEKFYEDSEVVWRVYYEDKKNEFSWPSVEYVEGGKLADFYARKDVRVMNTDPRWKTTIKAREFVK